MPADAPAVRIRLPALASFAYDVLQHRNTAHALARASDAFILVGIASNSLSPIIVSIELEWERFEQRVEATIRNPFRRALHGQETTHMC